MDACINWSKQIDRHGYGRCTHGGRRGALAHRVAWERVNGPIPDGMAIDHICFNPACVNVKHLRLLPLNENAALQRSSFKTHCKNGHAFTAANTYHRPLHLNGRRNCRACNLAAVTRYKQRTAA